MPDNPDGSIFDLPKKMIDGAKTPTDMLVAVMVIFLGVVAMLAAVGLVISTAVGVIFLLINAIL